MRIVHMLLAMLASLFLIYHAQAQPDIDQSNQHAISQLAPIQSTSQPSSVQNHGPLSRLAKSLSSSFTPTDNFIPARDQHQEEQDRYDNYNSYGGNWDSMLWVLLGLAAITAIIIIILALKEFGTDCWLFLRKWGVGISDCFRDCMRGGRKDQPRDTRTTGQKVKDAATKAIELPIDSASEAAANAKKSISKHLPGKKPNPIQKIGSSISSSIGKKLDFS